MLHYDQRYWNNKRHWLPSTPIHQSCTSGVSNNTALFLWDNILEVWKTYVPHGDMASTSTHTQQYTTYRRICSLNFSCSKQDSNFFPCSNNTIDYNSYENCDKASKNNSKSCCCIVLTTYFSLKAIMKLNATWWWPFKPKRVVEKNNTMNMLCFDWIYRNSGCSKE